MGCGIAAVAAVAGLNVLVCDTAVGARERVDTACESVFAELVAGKAIAPDESQRAASRIEVVARVDDLRGLSFVVEAITESLDAKHALYRELESVLAADAIIASSTSGFTPDMLARPFEHAERFLVAHYWNPPHLIPLVEVVPGAATARSTVDLTLGFLRHCRCEPVVLHKAVPGFIGNRLQFAVLREALHLLREGVASAETIDTVMRQSLGRRYRWFGPLEGADLGGLHTFSRIASHLWPLLAKNEEPLEILEQLVADGHNGRSAGQGLHRWTPEREERVRRARLAMLAMPPVE